MGTTNGMEKSCAFLLIFIRMAMDIWGFAAIVGTHPSLVYSARSASIGESRMAFMAGYSPKQMPSTAEKTTDINIH